MRSLPTPMCRINGMSPCPADFEEDVTGWTINVHCAKELADILLPSIGQERVDVVLMSGEHRERRRAGSALIVEIVYDGDPKYVDWPCVVTLSGSIPLLADDGVATT